MAIWKDKVRKDYCYDFQYKKQRYGGRGFKTKKEAGIALSIRRQKLLFKTNTVQEGEIDISKITDYYSFLREKYKKFLVEPTNTLPDLIDMVFKDFELSYSYADIRKIVLSSKRKSLPVKLRLEILNRDGHACVLCGNGPPQTTLQVDHIVPISRGGLSEARNLRTLCQACNRGKLDQPFSVSG